MSITLAKNLTGGVGALIKRPCEDVTLFHHYLDNGVCQYCDKVRPGSATAIAYLLRQQATDRFEEARHENPADPINTEAWRQGQALWAKASDVMNGTRLPLSSE